MPVYQYTARNRQGQTVRGQLRANDPFEVQAHLRAQGLQVTALREKPERNVLFLRTLPPQAQALFFRHLQSSLKAGVGLPDALSSFADDQPNSPLGAAAREMAKDLSQGSSVHRAFQDHCDRFPSFALAMIRAGEQSGRLDEVFGYLAQHYDREHRFYQNIRARTFYPRILIGIMVVLILFALFISPLIARALNPQVGPFILEHHRRSLGPGALVAQLIAFLVIGITVWSLLRRIPHLGAFVETVRLSIPWFSNLHRLLYAARFGRTLAMLYSAGVEPGESLLLAGEASGSHQIMEATRRVAGRLQKGESLTSVVRDIPLLPPMVVHIVTSGEKTGTVDEALNRAAEYLESEAEVAVTAQGTVIGIGTLLLVLALGAVYIVSFWIRWYGGLIRAVDEFMNAP